MACTCLHDDATINLLYFNIALEYTRFYLKDEELGPSLMLGAAGTYMVGALISNALDDTKTCQKCVDAYLALGKVCIKPHFLKQVPTSCSLDELATCVASLTCSAGWANRCIPWANEHPPDVAVLPRVPESRTYRLSNTSKRQSTTCCRCSSPTSTFPPLSTRSKAPSTGQNPSSSCTGVTVLLVRAFTGRSVFVNIVWNELHLLSVIGPGLCHGVAGCGYVFLLLHRLTGDVKFLHRSLQFARFVLSPDFKQYAKIPDSPFSLFEGWGGAVCFMADLLQPEKAAFPLLDVLEF
ncbi:hypothetical protein C0Q70_10648 [Pomacea canaliculata]|uniref:Uncharacterized protein n=1 Tax=Pomacea canaliculata TaxID=400727 RepID=A0A2T7P3R2_POMCA|nr:hypothetical protein C0Q70_10648 [Pomacea canaliculata]